MTGVSESAAARIRVLVYFRSEILRIQGTPLRCRNLALALGRRKELAVKVLSADDQVAVREAVPDLDQEEHGHERQPGDALRDCVARFRPHIVYGQTHKSLPDLARLRGPDSPLRVADLHGDYPRWRLEQRRHPLYRRLASYARFRLGERLHGASMDGFTVVSHYLARRVRRLGKPHQLLWGGVDLDSFRPASTAENGRIRVAYAGNYQPYHGIDSLLRAASGLIRRSPEFLFTLIGNIDESPEIRRQAESELAGHLTITGQVPYEAIPALLGKADILVIPRATGPTARSTYPSKLSEALALGKPIVTTDVGEVPRIVSDGETALLVPPAAPAALERALYRLRDPELRHRLGRSARELAERELGWERVAERASGFFQRLLEARR